MSDVSKILDAAADGSVTFMGESAGYRNAIGTYKIAADGSIYDVKILFANASLAGSGGDLVSGKSSAGFEMGAADKVGFFVVPDAFSQSTASLLSSQAGSFKFVDAKGNPGNVNGGVELKLQYVSDTGKATDIKSTYGTSVFHSVDDGSKGLNGDGLVHVKMSTAADGSVTVGFEDLKGGGDKDYDDAVFKFTPSEASKAFSAAAKAAADAPYKASGELLVDGSFEQSKAAAGTWTHASAVGGWRSDTEVETWGKGFGGIKATEGDKFAELDYDSSGKLSNIYQNVKTEAGAEYTFTFDYMKRPDSKAGSDTINVFWNGNLVGSVDPTKSEWSGASFKVLGTGGSDRIEFRESASQNDSYGGLIDNASLKKSGASAAEKEAAVKAEIEKAIAEKAAAEAAAKEAAEKAAAEAAAKEAAEKAAAEAAAKEAAEKAAAEAAAKEAAEKAAAEAAAKEAAEKAAWEAAHAEKIVLKADNADESVLSSHQVGTDAADEMKGATGSDAIFGKAGEDKIVASNARMNALKLPIEASLVNAVDASAVKIVVSGMPQDAKLSAGQDNGDGSWTLGANELKDLVISTSAGSDFSLKVAAFATDGSGLSDATEVTVHVPAAAHNLLSGGGGADVVVGSDAGNDYLYGGSIPTGVSNPHAPTVADNDVIHAGNGNNHVWGNAGDDEITAGNGDNWISGGKGNDYITVGSGNNEIYGNTGDDTILVGGGDNVVHGGEGYDTLDFRWGSASVTIDVKAHTATTQYSGGVTTFDGIEHFVGTMGDDTFIAGKKGEVFSGGLGDDTFVFGRGDVVSKGVALAPHEITDFGQGDTLDLRGIFAGHNWQGLDKMVQLVEDGQGTHVYAKVSQQMVEVTVLDNFHGHTVAEMVKDGSLLV